MDIRTNVLRWALVAWALAYGALRTYWAAGHLPFFPPIGSDLVSLSGWGVVGLTATAALVGLLSSVRSLPAPARRVVAVGGLASAAGLVFAPLLLLLDVVAVLFPGTGIPFSLAAFASRLGCLAGGLLAGAIAVRLTRELRGVCPRCGRRSGRVADGRTPRWAYAAAYLAVFGCLIRLGAQAWVGFDAVPHGYAGTSAVLFLVAVVLAGTLLPLSLVHSWGRWLPSRLGGRRVPRRLPLGPALFVSVGLTAYFGTGFVQLVTEGVTPDMEGLPAAFYWVAIPAYLLWGVGLLVAALAYRSHTRPACGTTGTALWTTRTGPALPQLPCTSGGDLVSAMPVEPTATMGASTRVRGEVTSMNATAEPLTDWPTLLHIWQQLDLPEGWQAEITEWGITMTPPPRYVHNRIADLINRALVREAPEQWGIFQTQGIAIAAPERLYIPDILVVSNADLADLAAAEDALPVPADRALLVVEITSPSNASHDRRSKLFGYAHGEVPLYLLIDRCHPNGKRCTVYSEPKDGDYQRSVTSPFGEPVHLPAPFDLELDTSRFE